jgi:hypothetical protein
MIKYIYRFVLILLAGLGLLTTYNLTEAYVISGYLTREGEKALLDENYDFFLPSRYYNQNLLVDTVFSHEDTTLKIKIYEVARIMIYEEGLQVEDGIFLLIEQVSGTDLHYTFDIEFISNDDLVIEYFGKKQFTLPLYITMQGGTERTVLLKEDFYNEENDVYLPLTSIKIYQNKVLSFEIPVTIDFNQFVIRDQIQSYLDLHDEAPEEAAENYSIAPVIKIEDTKGFILRNMIIYVATIIVLTVVFFRYKNNRLGKKKATEGLQKDVKKIYEKQEKKR